MRARSLGRGGREAMRRSERVEHFGTLWRPCLALLGQSERLAVATKTYDRNDSGWINPNETTMQLMSRGELVICLRVYPMRCPFGQRERLAVALSRTPATHQKAHATRASARGLV